MGKWKGIVGQSFTPDEFREYVAGLNWDDWRPEFIVLHHTAEPSLAQRPSGFICDHMSGLENYYRDEMGWSAGPHLFVDDRQVWVFTPLTTPGVHAKSFNSGSIGVEMLGNYDVEAFTSGRGAKVRDNAVAAIAILSDTLDIDPDSIMCHREEPDTTKTCPGANVNKADFIQAVQDYLATDAPNHSKSSNSSSDALLGEAWGVQTDPASPGTSASPVFQEAAPAHSDGYRVTTAHGLNIRSGPGTAYKVVGTIRGGEIITPLKTTGWMPVLLDDKSIGWLALDYLTPVSPAFQVPEVSQSAPAPDKMATSRNGLEFIKSEEGCVLHVYKDAAGYPTIGVGHLIKAGESFTTITEDEATNLLAQDAKIAEDAVNRNVKVPLTQNQFDALVSFTFNCGTGAFEKSTLLKLLNQGQYDAVPSELAKWVKSGGKTISGLVKRRQREGELFMEA